MSIGFLTSVALSGILITVITRFATSRFPPEDSTYADGWAGALSVVFPGDGHVYKGYVGTGMLLMLVIPVCYRVSGLLGVVLHLFVVIHSIRVKLANRIVREPERARCSVCGREYPDGELVTHAGKLWCARDYQAALTAG